MAHLLLVYWAGTLVSNDAVFIKIPLFALAIWVFLKSSGIILKLWVLTSSLALAIYPRHVPEYYFMLITPIVLIYTVGYLQKNGLGKLALITILIASVGFGIFRLKNKDNKLGLYYKNEAVKFIANQANSQPVTIYYSNEPGEKFGFDYLFWWHKVKIIDNADQKFLIIVPVSSRIYRPSWDFGRIKVYPLPKEQ